MIELTETEQLFVKLAKGKLNKRSKLPISVQIEILFAEQYGYKPSEDNNYETYKYSLYNLLMRIVWKIEEPIQMQRVMSTVIEVSLKPNVYNDDLDPLYRVILELFYFIRYTRYLDDTGKPRFQLNTP